MTLDVKSARRLLLVSYRITTSLVVFNWRIHYCGGSQAAAMSLRNVVTLTIAVGTGVMISAFAQAPTTSDSSLTRLSQACTPCSPSLLNKRGRESKRRERITLKRNQHPSPPQRRSNEHPHRTRHQSQVQHDPDGRNNSMIIFRVGLAIMDIDWACLSAAAPAEVVREE